MEKIPKSLWLYFQIVLVTLFCFSLSSISSQPLHESETHALIEFKKHLNDPFNFLDSWRDYESPCRFLGVSCNPNTGRVTEISLGNKSLSGSISPSISMLQSLTSLVIPLNFISGVIPFELISCSGLKVLNLSANHLNGSIPDLSRLRSLEFLDLSSNYFSGKFPAWVGNLVGLKSLGLGYNQFDEGEIPQNLGNLKKLTWLYLPGSHFTGEIPESLFELKALGTFDMAKNKISGKFPSSISKLKNLFQIELFENRLTGEIPLEFSELTLLKELDISRNQLYGTLPPGIGNLKHLTVFQVFNNNFSGQLPEGFGDMKHLKGFSIYKNKFSGEFPVNFGRYSPLNALDISENKFSGPFPRFLCANRILQFLLALDNNFSGELPDTYADCKSLTRVRINQNQLSGSIPEGLWALPDATIIDFSDNNFTGGMSSQIVTSTKLNQLILQNNKFSGELPSEIGKLAQLERLWLSNNDFSGRIPSGIGFLKQLSSLFLDKNSFTGSIPAELGQCSRLVDLNLASNSLIGSIPNTLAQMTSLNALNLSTNELTGSIPYNLKNLRLSSIDLSHNVLSGKVPSDLLTLGGIQAFSGNKDLCTDESTHNPVTSSFSVCSRESGHEGFVKRKSVMLCILLVALVIIFAGLLLLSHRNFKLSEAYRNGNVGEKDSKWNIKSFYQVEFEADEICNLDENNMVGSGGTGKVYRLDLKKGRGTVAVKQLWKGTEIKVLSAEMGILENIRHRNILKLYACLMKEGSNLLVFEYMANGNLFQALHREIKGQPELDWYKRYKIALGAAKAIAYLHHDCAPPIIHRDVKSSNILLDEDYEAKVADFGLAKVAKGSNDRSEPSCFAGTLGYVAPERAYIIEATVMSDVYSFGVVLLELVTGRRPLEEAYGEGKDIVCWVSIHLNDKESVLEVLDQNVLVSERVVQDDMIKVLKIAAHCTTKLPNQRPNMRDVVKMLIDADPSLPGCHHHTARDAVRKPLL